MQKRLSAVRKHMTAAQRKQVLFDYRRSQLTQVEFALQAGVGLSTLQLWLRQEREAACAATTFVAVPNLLAKSPAPAVYRLRLVGGAVLEIGSEDNCKQLEPLLKLLKVL